MEQTSISCRLDGKLDILLIIDGVFFLRMQRRKGQFAGRASLEGESPAPGCDPGSQSSGLDFVSRESKYVLYPIS
jgi:hypothetical protein